MRRKSSDGAHSTEQWHAAIVTRQRRQRARLRRRRAAGAALGAVAALTLLGVTIDDGPADRRASGAPRRGAAARTAAGVAPAASATTFAPPAPASASPLPASSTAGPATIAPAATSAPSTSAPPATASAPTASPAPAPAPAAAVAEGGRPFALPGECLPAGEDWLDVGIGPPLRRLEFGGTTIAVARLPDAGDEPAETISALANTPDAGTIAAVLHTAGSDRLLVYADATSMWTPVAEAIGIRSPALSLDGSRVAFVADGRVAVATASGGWVPEKIATPMAGGIATDVRFVDGKRLVASVTEPVRGVRAELAALSDLWAYEPATDAWTRLTSAEADLDRWSLALTPVAAADDASVLYVRFTGLGSGSADDRRAELREVSAAGASALPETVMAEVPHDAQLVAADAGWTLWSVPDDQARTHLVVRSPDGLTTALGCGTALAVTPRDAETVDDASSPFFALSLVVGVATPAPPAPGQPRWLADIDAPDPFALVHNGEPYVFTTNAGWLNVPVATHVAGAWPVIADALPELPAWAEPGFTWAPAVARTDGGWTLWFTARDAASGRQCIGAARSLWPQGPYDAEADPLVCEVDRGGSIDPSPVFGADGRLYLLFKSDGNCCGLITTIDAVALDPTGTALVGGIAELVRADEPWEGGLVEAPSMRVEDDGTWTLLYSANRWDTAAYAVGAARCESPLGPCRKQDATVLDDDAHPGAGGAEFVPGTSLVVLHEWAPAGVGYRTGSQRRLRLGWIDTSCGPVTIGVIHTALPDGYGRRCA